MKLAPEWEAKLEKICNLGIRRLVRHNKCFYKKSVGITSEWDARFYRLIERERRKASGKDSLWNKKLRSLTSSWNIWCYQIKGQPPTLITRPYKSHSTWDLRFHYMLKRFYAEYKLYGWDRKIDTLRRIWADTGKQIKGGIGSMDERLANERLGITDLRGMLLNQNYRCALTGRTLTPDNCSLDHIIPLGRGGTHTKDNAQLVCEEVNRAKGTMTDEELVELCRDVIACKDNKS